MQAHGDNAGNCACLQEPLLITRWEGTYDYLTMSHRGYIDPVTLLLHVHSHSTGLEYTFVT